MTSTRQPAASAEAAGCRVLVIPNHVPVPPGPRRVQLETLVGLEPQDLVRLHR